MLSIPATSAPAGNQPTHGLAPDVNIPDGDSWYREGVVQTLLTLGRGLLILELVSASKGPVGARALSTSSGVNLSTTYQILRTLRDGEYVVRHRGGAYSVGPAVVRMAGQLRAMPSALPAVESALKGLFLGTGETSYLVGWWLSRIVICSAFEGDQALRVGRLDVGYSGAPHARASCKAIMAYLRPEDVRSYLAEFELEPLTPNTLTTLDMLERDLKRTRARGYAVDGEEFALGVVCYSAPVFDADNFPRYSLTVSLPQARVGSRELAIVDHLLGAARTASRSLGYRGAFPRKGVASLEPQTPQTPLGVAAT